MCLKVRGACLKLAETPCLALGGEPQPLGSILAAHSATAQAALQLAKEAARSAHFELVNAMADDPLTALRERASSYLAMARSL